MATTRRARLAVIAASAAYVLGVAAFYCWGYREEWADIPFDASLWAEAGQSGRGRRRQRMIAAIETRLRDGAWPTSAEVEDALGPSDVARTRSDGIMVWKYSLGPAPGFMELDDLWLTVTFDAEGRRLGHEVRPD